MTGTRNTLRRVAIVLNGFSVSWWIWSATRTMSEVGMGAAMSSGALLWVAFVIPPATAILALTRRDTTMSRQRRGGD